MANLTDKRQCRPQSWLNNKASSKPNLPYPTYSEGQFESINGPLADSKVDRVSEWTNRMAIKSLDSEKTQWEDKDLQWSTTT